MIQITLKAKHYYYIVRFLKNFSLEQYFSLFSRIKTALENNTDDEAEFSVTASVDEVIAIYKILTILPEGQANSINVEMGAMIQTEIQNGVTSEIASNIENGPWQLLGTAITQIRNENTLARLADIQTGKNLLTNE